MKIARITCQLVVCLTSLCLGQAAAAAEFRPFVIKPSNQKIPGIAVYVESSGCSAVAIGPHVLLTAAHCVDNGIAELPKLFWYERLFKRSDNQGKCSCLPTYLTSSGRDRGCTDALSSPSPEEDLALCVFERKLPAKYQRAINPNAEVEKGNRVLFAGFGCVDKEDCSPYSRETPNKSNEASHGWSTIVDAQNQKPYTWIIKGDLDGGDSALCAGDSGGPAFVGPDWNRVVAINREACVPPVPGQEGDVARSALTPIGAQDTIDWMCDWVKQDLGVREIRGLVCSP